uniref:MFS domain-containing protein n=1 Tax=Steinernema glaseri TaxID=37863 RepID=A0A1I8AH31_9BILA
MPKTSKDRLVLILQLVSFLDMCGASFVVTVLPEFFRTEIGLSVSAAGVLASVYGVFQFLTSPLIGSEADRLGYQTVTLACLVLTTLSYGLLQTSSFWLIVLSRLLCGTFKHTQSTCRSLLGILTKDDQKGQVAALGRFNSMSNLAFIFTPTLAGWANVLFGYRVTFLIGTSAFAVNAVLTVLFIPNVRDAAESKASKEASESWLHPVIALFDQFRQVDWNKFQVIFAIRLLTTYVMILYRSNFNWFMRERFEADTAMQGYLISWQGLTQFLISFNIGAVMSFIGIPLGRLLYLNCIAFGAVFLGLSFASSFWIYTFFLTILNILS